MWRQSLIIPDRITFRRAAHQSSTPPFSIRNRGSILCSWSTQVSTFSPSRIYLFKSRTQTFPMRKIKRSRRSFIVCSAFIYSPPMSAKCDATGNRPNIILSATKAGLLPPASHTPYLPPHPARGTPYHRYVLLLLPHGDPNVKLSLPSAPLERSDFDLRSFVQEHALRTDGGGAFMWRAVWDEESSRIWREVISERLFFI